LGSTEKKKECNDIHWWFKVRTPRKRGISGPTKHKGKEKRKIIKVVTIVEPEKKLEEGGVINSPSNIISEVS